MDPGLLRTFSQRGLHTDERIGWAHASAAERWPDRDALVLGDRRLTYRALYGWVLRVAHELVEAGVRPGDRLLWQVPNCLEGLVIHLAGWRIGATCVPVVPLYREHELEHILRETRPTAVAFASELGRTRRRAAEEMQVLMERVGVQPRVRYAIGRALEGWRSLPEPPEPGETVPEAGLPDPAAADEACLILYTSGTTSAPKGVRHASRSLVAEARTMRDAYGLGCHDTFVMGAPITHIAGLLLALVLPAAIGARTAVLAAWDPDEAVAVAHREHATFCQGATVFLQGFVERYEHAAPDLHRLTRFMCGGSTVPPSLIERADAVGVKAWRAWGMTEAPTTSFSRPEDPLERRAHSEGRPSPHTQIEAVDPERRPVPAGEVGELRVRSPEQMLGYTDRAVDAAQVDADGWFYSGDAGFVDAAGWVTMTGRLKDIINRGGEKFSAQDIEGVIAGHPAIAAAAVLGVPDDRLGERVAAFVVLAPGQHEWPGDAAMLEHLERRRMARQKHPVEWHVLDALPTTGSGKVQKHLLLGRWHEELAHAVVSRPPVSDR